MAELPTPEQIREVARDVLRELTGVPTPQQPAPARGLISQGEVREAAARAEKVLWIGPDAIVTPLARDLAWDLGIELRRKGAAAGQPAPGPAATVSDGGPAPAEQGGPIALGADHGGFPLKEQLKKHLEARGLKVLDLGTHSTDACDYPDLAAAVAKAVALGQASWGILVDGAGIGSCMAANKVPGVLAATCHDERTAKNSREHNGANVLCLGSGSLEAGAALKLVDAWLATPFAGGRHAKRVDKIKALERSFVR